MHFREEHVLCAPSFLEGVRAFPSVPYCVNVNLRMRSSRSRAFGWGTFRVHDSVPWIFRLDRGIGWIPQRDMFGCRSKEFSLTNGRDVGNNNDQPCVQTVLVHAGQESPSGCSLKMCSPLC
jgi:hypothetical protein